MKLLEVKIYKSLGITHFYQAWYIQYKPPYFYYNRVDGPACDITPGIREWWIDGVNTKTKLAGAVFKH
jgi:hypothetical protein